MKSKLIYKPQYREIRIIEKFLLFPKYLPISKSSQYFQIKWLEKAKIMQIYGISWESLCWVD